MASDPSPRIFPRLGGGEAVFDPMIARATAEEPGRRYPSAGDLAAAAEAALDGRGEPTVERTVATDAAAHGHREGEDGEPETGDSAKRDLRLAGRAGDPAASRAGLLALLVGAAGGDRDRRMRFRLERAVIRQTTVTARGDATAARAPTAKGQKEALSKARATVTPAEPEPREVDGSIHKAKVPVEWGQNYELE